MKSIVALTLGIATLIGATAASAQKPADCDGTLEVIRFSQLKPGKTLADFQAVVDQHMAWYRKHGYTKNKQVVMPVVTIAGTTATEVVSFHTNAPGVPMSEHDAQWDDFVNAYRMVSTVEAMRTVCVPK